jgi:UDP-N-acetylglucosamine 2-epimerase (non-hydrolysing)
VICAVYGTTGELIKLAPVLSRLRARGHPFLTVTTGQQVTQIPRFLDELGLPQPTLWLGYGRGGRDLSVVRDIAPWLPGVVARSVQHAAGLRRRLRRGKGRPAFVVHGDTMTTVLGAVLGRVLGMPVAHIESGLRSYDWRHPFPEEVNRRAASIVATIHYAPGAWAAANVKRGNVVDTGSNTIRDSLDLCRSDAPLPLSVPDRPFGIVSLHRFELLNEGRLLHETMGTLAAHSAHPLLFVDHPVTAAAVRRHGLDGAFAGPRIARIPRLTFFGFVALLRRAAFIVTDSGGNQEEAYYLDVPCLVHRRRTERREGLGENVVLSGYDSKVMRDFLADPSRYRRHSDLPHERPSDVIVSDLEARGLT